MIKKFITAEIILILLSIANIIEVSLMCACVQKEFFEKMRDIALAIYSVMVIGKQNISIYYFLHVVFKLMFKMVYTSLIYVYINHLASNLFLLYLYIFFSNMIKTMIIFFYKKMSNMEIINFQFGKTHF